MDRRLGRGPGAHPPSPDGVLTFEGTAADGFVEDCGTARAGRVVAAVRVTLPEEWRAPELCVAVSLRASAEAAWWFVVPPEPDEPVVACASTESRDGDSLLVRASLVVEENVFAFVHAWLRQDASSTTRLVEPVTAAFATTEDRARRFGGHPQQRPPRRDRGRLGRCPERRARRARPTRRRQK